MTAGHTPGPGVLQRGLLEQPVTPCCRWVSVQGLKAGAALCIHTGTAH